MMRYALLSLGLMLFGAIQAQNDHRTVLATDPYQSGGYFIKDVNKCQAEGIGQIDIKIVAASFDGKDTLTRVLQELTIKANDFYAQVGKDLIAQELRSDEVAYYELQAHAASGGVVFDYAALPDGEGTGKNLCHVVCDGGTTWAWAINVSDNEQLGKTYLHFGNAYGLPAAQRYFYVPLTEWNTFEGIYPSPTYFGLGADGGWNYYMANHMQVDVVKLEPNLPGGGGGAPEGAKSWLGYDIAPHTAVVGIRKDPGKYRVLNGIARTLDYLGGDPCNNAVALYNTGSEVQTILAANNLDPLICPNTGPTVLDSTDWWYGNNGNNPFEHCGSQPLTGDLFAWMNQYFDCLSNVNGSGGGGSGGGGSGGGHTWGVYPEIFRINHWYGDGTLGNVFEIGLPKDKDPKLIPVDRTELMPGFYELVMVLNSGQIVRHYEEISEPRVIHADFADFINVNIYPVPVKGESFAIDFDMLVPSSVAINIVNNMGKEYYYKELYFDLPGENKHVVEMGHTWPNGLYHAIFQYGDGSSISKNFTVN